MDLIRMYIENMLIYMFVATPFYVVGRLVFIKIKQQQQMNLLREIVMAGFTVYMIGLASQTILPQWDAGISPDTGKIYLDVYRSNAMASVNWIPLQTIFDYSFQTNELVGNWEAVSFLNLAGNVFLFSPIGFFLPLFWGRWRTFRKILLFGLGTTCFIEFVQFFIGRSSDVDDVLLNTIGVLVGYGAFLLIKQRESKPKQERKYNL